jgi:hypothetical protein
VNVSPVGLSATLAKVNALGGASGVKGAIAGGEGDGSGEGAGVVAAGVAAGALTTWVRVGDVLALLLASPA